MEKLLGPDILAAAGAAPSPTSAAVTAEVVGLYFSAHWCPPCRGMTPKLAEIYTDLQKQGTSFQIVFVSSDKSQEEFDSYHAEMPWLALPYGSRDKKNELSSKFGVRGIPTLVLVNGKDGATITTKGREAVMGNPAGFPWKPPTLAEMLGGPLRSKADGEDMTPLKLKPGGHVGLYFSAHWCPPCQRFTPKLIEAYNAVKAAGKDFEVVFVSSDRDQAGFDEYYGAHPWRAVPYDDKKTEQALSAHFEVQGIPTLVILDADRNVVSTKAVGAVSSDPKGANFPWAPPLVQDLDEDPSDINEKPCVVAMMEKAEDAWDDVEEVLNAVAEAEKAKGSDLVFFKATEMGGIGQQVRKVLQLPPANKEPVLVLTNLGAGGGFFKGPAKITRDSVTQLIADYRAGSLERCQAQ